MENIGIKVKGGLFSKFKSKIVDSGKTPGQLVADGTIKVTENYGSEVIKETNRKKESLKEDRAMFPEGTIDLIQEIEKEREGR